MKPTFTQSKLETKFSGCVAVSAEKSVRFKEVIISINHMELTIDELIQIVHFAKKQAEVLNA